jgi:shikimate dehydrogenase
MVGVSVPERPSVSDHSRIPQIAESLGTDEPGDTPRVRGISGSTRLVGLLGWPVEHSLSPAMHNAAFAAVGLDWAYVPLPTPPERLAEAIRGLLALGFAGANVTSPHKLATTELVETDVPSVNALVVRDGRVEGRTTDAAVLAGLLAERPVVVGGGGAAVAFLHALPAARRFSRRGEWPPDVRDADLVVNATSARDEVVVELGPGQTLVDLPYPETATAAAARSAGATVVGGLEVLVAQGAASFELWTGVPAPVPAMRAALGLPS